MQRLGEANVGDKYFNTHMKESLKKWGQIYCVTEPSVWRITLCVELGLVGSLIPRSGSFPGHP